MTIPALITLAADDDKARVTPFVEALSATYPTLPIACPIAPFLAAELTETLQNAKAICLFLSKSAVELCDLRRLTELALAHDIPILKIYLEEVTLSPGLHFMLSLCPEFFPNRHETIDSAVETLKHAHFLKEALA